jgi:type II secretory pathway pseudopilin PulG
MAFTLIEVIGVLGIIAILVAATLPVVIRQIDYANQANEATNLLALASGFTQAVSAQRYIPSQTNCATFIASNIGWQLAAVSNTVNNPQNPRAFLMNPAMAKFLPYQQPSNGCSSNPSPQFIIISSLSSLLPPYLNSGTPASSSDFNALWNTPLNTIPTNTVWFQQDKWQGQGADITIQDINLASSFIHLVLTVDSATATNAAYSIDSFGLAIVTTNTPVTNYFLRGTVLNLYYTNANNTTTNTLQASQVLRQDSSWVFSAGLWRNSPSNVASASGSGTYGGLQSIVQTFYTNSLSTTNIYNDMTNFMGFYMTYANTNFSQSSPAYSALQTNVNSISNDVTALITSH